MSTRRWWRSPRNSASSHLLYNHLGQFRAYHTGAKGQNVGVIVLLGELSGVRLTANHSPDPRYLIGRQGDSYAGAADEDTRSHSPETTAFATASP